MGTICSILFSMLCAYICIKLAQVTNSNKFIAAILGAVFNVLAIAGYGIYTYCRTNKN